MFNLFYWEMKKKTFGRAFVFPARRICGGFWEVHVGWAEPQHWLVGVGIKAHIYSMPV